MLGLLLSLFVVLISYSLCQDLTKLTSLNSDLQSGLAKECAPLGKVLSDMPAEVQVQLAINMKTAPATQCFNCDNLTDVAKSYASWISSNNKSNTDYISAKKKPLANCSVLQDSLQTSGTQEVVSSASDISTAINKVVPETQNIAIAVKNLVESVWKFNFRIICTAKTDITSATKDSEGYYTTPTLTKSEGTKMVASFISLIQSNDNINNAVADSTISCLNKIAMLDACRLNNTQIEYTNATNSNSNMLGPSGSGQGQPNKIKKLDKMAGCNSIIKDKNQNQQSLNFDSLKKILNNIPAKTGNRILQNNGNPQNSNSNSNCGVGFGSNGQPQLPIPQDVIDSSKAILKDFTTNFDAEAGAYFEQIYDQEKCIVRRLNEKNFLDRPTDIIDDDLTCKSGINSHVSCINGLDSTVCTCKRGTCGSIARTHSSDQVKQNNANYISFRFDFICLGNTNSKKPTIFFVTFPKVTNSTTVLCEADVKIGDSLGLGSSASLVASNCASIGFEAALTGQVTARAMQRGYSRTDDLVQMGNQCFSPMKDDCKRKMIDAFTKHKMDNSTMSSDQSQIISLCNDSGLTDEQLALCTSFIISRAFNGLKLKPVTDISEAVTVSTATGTLRLLETSAPLPMIVSQTNSAIDAKIDPVKLNVAGSISIDGSTPTNQATVSDQLKQIQSQKVEFGGSASLISLSLIMTFLISLFVF